MPPVLSLERALFLAKEAGIFTTKEIQTHILKSPSFSKSKSPFLIDDFFFARTEIEVTILPKKSKALEAMQGTLEGGELSKNESMMTRVPDSVHENLIRAFNPRQETFFVGDREFKWSAEGRGTKKRATAHARLVRGTGIVKVNGEQDFWKRWPLYYNRFDVLQPFLRTGTSGEYDLYISVDGGGISGQSCAARLAVARALVDACPSTALELGDALIEDTRQKVSKMSGRNAAFARDKNKR